MVKRSGGRVVRKTPAQIEVRPFRRWWIARYGDLKATGNTRTEALAHMLLTLRDEVEVMQLEVEWRKRAEKEGGERR